MTEILNHNAKQAISMAYDEFEKQEFLDRIFDYIKSSIDLAKQQERFDQRVNSICDPIIKQANK